MEDIQEYYSRLKKYGEKIVNNKVAAEKVVEIIKESFEDYEKIIDIIYFPKTIREVRIAEIYYDAVYKLEELQKRNNIFLSVIPPIYENKCTLAMIEAVKVMLDGGIPENLFNDHISPEENAERIFGYVMQQEYGKDGVKYICKKAGLDVNSKDDETKFSKLMETYLKTNGNVETLDPLNIKVDQLDDDKITELERYAAKIGELVKNSSKNFSTYEEGMALYHGYISGLIPLPPLILDDPEPEVINGDEIGGTIK